MKKNTIDQENAAISELLPLTDKLYTDFSIEVLEQRLETDPLLLSGLFEEITPYCAQCKKSDLDCSENCVRCNKASYGNTCKCKITDADIDIDCFKS
ncbi:hypothetical protein [Rikenella microfusus]|uniref:hypothetical protein n=1 Tax=Rikenella microfusus TaxID=28139 RepID=UPI00248D9F86|nr:hypothetical protein [Rikenella microfusus]